MANYQELAGLSARLDRVEFVPRADNPADRPHRFVYYITIHNNSLRVVTVSGRKWLVVDAQGRRLMVEGDGVVGQFPRLTPGDSFQYNSYHLIASDSTAEGAYLAKDEDGQDILIRIPQFKMEIPGQKCE
ncbi:MAG: ApaG domain [Verrucomicrobiales bacterium]|jgi:ApaG protein|nr:ApaG domain [Verrucomicrobiales bacterium]